MLLELNHLLLLIKLSSLFDNTNIVRHYSLLIRAKEKKCLSWAL